MKFTAQVIWGKETRLYAVVDFLADTTAEAKNLICGIAQKHSRHDGDVFVEKFIEEIKPHAYKILLPEIVYRGARVAQPDFVVDASDGIFVEYREYLVSVYPFV